MQPEMPGPDAPLVKRLFRQTALTMLVLGAILFLTAGTIEWPGAWVLLAVAGALGLLSALHHRPPRSRALARTHARTHPARAKAVGQILLVVIMALCVAMPIAAGLDVRFGTSDIPAWLQVTGALAIAVGLYMFHVVMETNSYATAVVRIQSERGHQVISTGPYAFVRHPMYSGAIFYFLGMGLLLGSWWAVAIAVVIVALFALRAVWEENTLIAELPGYAAYAKRVRFRLIPGVW